MNIPDWLRSSTGQGVAMRWKALASAVIPTLALFGFMPEPDGQQLSDAVERVIVILWEGASLIALIAGIARRNFHKQNRLGKFAP